MKELDEISEMMKKCDGISPLPQPIKLYKVQGHARYKLLGVPITKMFRATLDKGVLKKGWV